MSRVQWLMSVQTKDGVQDIPFYLYDANNNPLEIAPETFSHVGYISNIPEEYIPKGGYESTDIREIVDDLDEDTEYWIVDNRDLPEEEFPRVPDIPGALQPTMFTAVPKHKVIDVYCRER